MPGPGKKKKKSLPKRPNVGRFPARITSLRPKLDTFFRDIDSIAGWGDVIAFLCRYFQFPDLNERSGLKKIHANFSEINEKLTYAYNEAKRIKNDKVMGGIVGIWAKMSVDALLMNRLFKQGLLQNLLPLLDNRTTRTVALLAFVTITRHDGGEVHEAIAKETPTFIRLLQEFPDDPEINELVISILARAVAAVIGQETVPERMKKIIDMPVLLKLMVDAMRKPDVKYHVPYHAVVFFSFASRHYAREMINILPLLHLFVACLRGCDLSLRCSVVVTLLRINIVGSEEEDWNIDVQKYITAVGGGFPEHLGDAVRLYHRGFFETETISIGWAMKDYRIAMIRCARDRDLYKLGCTLADLVVRAEYSVGGEAFMAYNERTQKMEFADIGLPFSMWIDAFPHCAKALRAKGELDKADILEIKHWITMRDFPRIIETAERCIERNPDIAYAYYAISLGKNQKKALRAAKKGLKAKQTNPFLLTRLLWRAVDNASQLGITTVSTSVAGGQRWSEGLAFLMSAYEDAKTFIAEAPPDTKHMLVVANWYIVLHIAIHGPELSPDLHELDPALEKFNLAEQFAQFLGVPTRKGQLRLAREMIMQLYPTAIKEFSSFITRLDNLNSSAAKERQQKFAEKAVDGLAAWLDEDLHPDDDDDGKTPIVYEYGHRKYQVFAISKAELELCRCSYCENPSAVLRKCGGCGKTRYCDASCQKLHWPDHKKACKASA